MKVSFYSRDVFGRTLFYPIPDSKWVTELTGSITVKPEHVKVLISAGIDVYVDWWNASSRYNVLDYSTEAIVKADLDVWGLIEFLNESGDNYLVQHIKNVKQN